MCSCGLVARAQEEVIRALFDTSDLSQAKARLLSICDDVTQGKLNISEYIFAKEVCSIITTNECLLFLPQAMKRLLDLGFRIKVEVNSKPKTLLFAPPAPKKLLDHSEDTRLIFGFFGNLNTLYHPFGELVVMHRLPSASRNKLTGVCCQCTHVYRCLISVWL